MRLRDYRGLIGVVQQNSELFQGTIEENVTYGLEPGTWSQESVIDACERACAHGFIKKFPEGYSTRVGERGVRISGGQKQRIAIARAFLRRPRILLLDEATSALDTESEGQVQTALDNLMMERVRIYYYYYYYFYNYCCNYLFYCLIMTMIVMLPLSLKKYYILLI